MDDNTKAQRMIRALERAADEERTSGDPTAADLLCKARCELPMRSLVTLYNLFETCATKQDALAALGEPA